MLQVNRKKIGMPGGVALSINEVYLALPAVGKVIVVDWQGNHVRSWGEHGLGPGEFYGIYGIAVCARIVFVSSFMRLQLFRKDGSYVRALAGVNRSFQNLIAGANLLYACSSWSHKVFAFAHDGTERFCIRGVRAYAVTLLVDELIITGVPKTFASRMCPGHPCSFYVFSAVDGVLLRQFASSFGDLFVLTTGHICVIFRDACHWLCPDGSARQEVEEAEGLVELLPCVVDLLECATETCRRPRLLTYLKNALRARQGPVAQNLLRAVLQIL